jgi:hypothetical protein
LDAAAGAAEVTEALPQDQSDDPAEVAYWRFDARRNGLADWKGRPMSERDAFKAEYPARWRSKVDPDLHQRRLERWPNRWRGWLLRIALGRSTFDYMLRSIRNDPRTPGARLVDIVVRQDAREVRTEADWVKTIARLTYHLETPERR